MTPTTLSTYGAPFVDESVVDNPETQITAEKFNWLCEHVAQLTHTAPRAIVHFVPVATAAPIGLDPSYHETFWGSGIDQMPSISKTATGEYTIEFLSTLPDGLSESETIAFTSALPTFWGASDTHVQLGAAGVTANTVSVRITDMAGTEVDATGTVVVWIR